MYHLPGFVSFGIASYWLSLSCPVISVFDDVCCMSLTLGRSHYNLVRLPSLLAMNTLIDKLMKSHC